MRQLQTQEIKAVWEAQPDRFPDFLAENTDLFPHITPAQKKENEALVQDFSQKMQKKLRQKPKDKAAQDALEQKLEADLMELLEKEKILSLYNWMDRQQLEAFKREAKHFTNSVRAFDESLRPAQIWQTLRNYFIYAMIVDMQGVEQHAEDPILAYSLLYPYTDNYIDDARITRQEKEHYNRMIAAKLKGESVLPRNPLEEKTCRLLDMILTAYIGPKQKKISESLLQLLEAQTCSIRQQKTDVTEDQILEISIWKGSSSVLTDYLFATEDWKEYEETFYLKFGFLLQLVDDLQDIEEDNAAGNHTLMTEADRHQCLERYVNRLLWFTWNEIRSFEPVNPALKGFVLKHCVEISLLSAAMNQQFFANSYLRALEPYLPFSLDFLQKIKKQIPHGKK